MLKTAKDKDHRSKLRQKLHLQLNIWLQREKDMEVAQSLGVQDVPQKLAFIRQEQAKLRKALGAIDRGFRRQRAWSQGKFLY